MQSWLNAFFLQALQLAQGQGFAVEVPLHSTVKTALANLAGAGTKSEFASRLAYGLGANMSSEGQQKLAAGLSKLLGEANLLGPAVADPLSVLRFLSCCHVVLLGEGIFADPLAIECHESTVHAVHCCPV